MKWGVPAGMSIDDLPGENELDPGPLVRGANNGWDVVPVSPPHAKVKRAGKMPGAYINGKWIKAFRFEGHEYSAEELANADRAGAGVGIRLRDGKFLVLDVDFRDAEASRRFLQLLADFDGGALLGTVYRVGKDPKFALIFRADQPPRLPKIRLIWDKQRTLSSKERQVLEIRRGTSHLVVRGIHPETLMPYRCYAFEQPCDAYPRVVDILGRRPEDVLKPITQEQVSRITQALIAMMQEMGWGEPRVLVGPKKRISTRIAIGWLCDAAVHYRETALSYVGKLRSGFR